MAEGGGGRGRETRRRRKIVDSGYDRMAFIAGRAQSLPPSPRHLLLHRHHFSDMPQGEHDDDLAAMLQKYSSDDASLRKDAFKYEPRGEPPLPNHVPKPIKQNSPTEIFNTGQEMQIKSSPPEAPSFDKNPDPKLHTQHPCFFTAKELSYSLVASESTRIICSVLIALLVVLSYIDYPLLGINIVNSKSIIAARPLYMLLLTDIAILIAHLALERRRRFDNDDVDKKGEGAPNWANAVTLLERGLVAHQTVRALFIDCSVYVVIVVCGLALA